MDETGLSTVPNKLPKVLASRGKKLVGKVASGERGQLITAVCCISAAGNYIPPALIFPRKRMKEELYANAPLGTLKLISDSGFINTELFCQWLVHFKNYSNPSDENPVLLILDNHSSHRDLQAIQYCRNNNINLLSLPPHASQKIQPLDVGFFGPLKKSYSIECDNWMISNPGKVISQFHVAGLFNASYSKVANLEKAQNSFRKAGIYPFSPEQFNDMDFAPSLVTDVPQHISEPHSEGITEIEDTHVHRTPPHAVSVCSNENDINVMNLDIVCEDGLIITNSAEHVQKFTAVPVTVAEIIPLPQIQEEQNRRKCRSQRSEILSSTPFKDDLESSLEEKKRKEGLKKATQTKRKIKDDKNKKKKVAKEHDEIIKCPGCKEIYLDPPAEDWIMCSACNKWWHEDCTTYVEGVFVCSNCCAE